MVLYFSCLSKITACDIHKLKIHYCLSFVFGFFFGLFCLSLRFSMNHQLGLYLTPDPSLSSKQSFHQVHLRWVNLIGWKEENYSVTSLNHFIVCLNWGTVRVHTMMEVDSAHLHCVWKFVHQIWCIIILENSLFWLKTQSEIL